MNRNTNHKEKKNNKWIGIAVFLLLVAPQLIPFAIICGSIGFVVKYLSKQQSVSQTSATRYTTRQESFDECPQSVFCRHKDKAVHHVRRGKEIDPWDRPDIDISKYQRNR